MRMRSPMRYAVNRTCREVTRNYYRQQRRNTYVNKQQMEVSNSDALFAWMFVIGFILVFGWICSL